MSNQADVHSIEELKDFRVALALFGEEALSALGAVEMEVRRTMQWLQQNRRMYWHEQIKRRREAVAMAKAEVFRRKLAKSGDHTPAFSEQKEILRQAEASLQEAEAKAALVRKWEPALQHAVFEYHGSIRRIKDIASGDVPRALILLGKLIDALEAYLRVAPPSGTGGTVRSEIESIIAPVYAQAVAEADAEAEAPETRESGPVESVASDSVAEPEEPAPAPQEPERSV